MTNPNPQWDFKASDFFVLRTPVLPFDEVVQWAEGLTASAAVNDLERLRVALNNDWIRLRSRLSQMLDRPDVREALFVASPDLEHDFDIWRSEPNSKRGRRIERALVRYFFRMTARATPFGLLAGCSLGLPGDETKLVVAKRDTYKRRTRLDMGYLATLSEAIRNDPNLRYQFSYKPNSSIYPAAGYIRYIETKSNQFVVSHNLVGVEQADHLALVLELAETGAYPQDLASALVEKIEDTTLEEAKEYVEALIDNQVLVCDLEPAVIGGEVICDLVGQLKQVTGGIKIANCLERVTTELESIDAQGLGVSPGAYRKIAATLEELPAKVDIQRLFQVDIFGRSTEATLGSELLEELHRGIQIMHRLSKPFDSGLKRFREAFVERYQSREVPLLEALDDELGIGFGIGGSNESSPLLQGLVLAPAAGVTFQRDAPHERLLQKFLDAHQNSAVEIVLNENDLAALASRNPTPLPDAVAVQAEVTARSAHALTEGNFRVELKRVGGPSGVNMFGRFCHLDEGILSHVKRHLHEEEEGAPDVIFAEVVHLPSGRLGNVICRPTMRDYEIVYLGRSTESSRQIPVSDLKVSVSGERIVLRSSKLGREVLPRLTNAHNFRQSGSLPVYQFLCTLQQQGTTSLPGWDWGALGKMPFLPRVVCGRLVLSRARWNLSAADLSSLLQSTSEESFQGLLNLREKLGFPRFVTLATLDTDSELVIDTENILSVESFIELIRKQEQGSVSLVEVLSNGPDGLCAHGPEGDFTHEIIVPFIKNRKQPAHRVQSATYSVTSSESGAIESDVRVFPPGSDWLYVKLYTGTATVDRVLRDMVRPIIEEARGLGAIDRWFFVRYGDPEWHLRLRLHGSHELLRTKVLPSLQTAASKLLHIGLLWRIQIDTYEREIERYGGVQGTILAEELFHADSELLLSMIEAYPGDQGQDARWLLSLRTIDTLFTCFGLDLNAKRMLTNEGRQALGHQLGYDVDVKHQLGNKYRQERRKIEGILDSENDQASDLRIGLTAIRKFSAVVTPLAGMLSSYEASKHLKQPIEKLLLDFTHMHANRSFRSSQPTQEFILYDFLVRRYESQLAQTRVLPASK